MKRRTWQSYIRENGRVITASRQLRRLAAFSPNASFESRRNYQDPASENTTSTGSIREQIAR